MFHPPLVAHRSALRHVLLPPSLPARADNQQVLRAYTAPKRVCDRCVKNCWTPRNTATTPRKPTAVDTTTDIAAKPAAGKDGRRVSLTVSASDANACPIVATATAPLSPGTPAAAGFFGPGCATPATATPAPTPVDGGGAGGTIKNTTAAAATSGSVDTRPPSASSHRRHHRRQVSMAMPSLPLASPAASASASPMTMMLPPPTPAAVDEGEDGDENDAMPPSAAASPSSSAPPAPFFGGRPGAAAARRSRRESSGGRLESRAWGGGRSLGLGGGGDVDNAVEELLQLQEAQKVETDGDEQQAQAATTAALPALPEEPAAPGPAAAAAAAAAKAEKPEEEEEVEEDSGEGGPMMIKITGYSGLAMCGVAVGTGVAIAVLLRSAFSLVFLF